MAACFWAYPKSFALQKCWGCGQSWAPTRWGGHQGVFACMSSRSAVTLPFHARKGAGGCSLSACESIAVHRLYHAFCGSSDTTSFVLKYCCGCLSSTSSLHRRAVLLSSCPCPPSPCGCPLHLPPAPSHSTTQSGFSISTFSFLSFPPSFVFW